MIRAVPYILTNNYKKYKDFLLEDFDVIYFRCDEVYDIVDIVHNVSDRIPIKTNNDFVNSVWQLEFVIYWTEEAENMFEPKHLLECGEIEKYYWNLLHGIEKSHELL